LVVAAVVVVKKKKKMKERTAVEGDWQKKDGLTGCLFVVLVAVVVGEEVAHAHRRFYSWFDTMQLDPQ
jgi:hypothetical protein